jgi:hypothetical protein
MSKKDEAVRVLEEAKWRGRCDEHEDLKGNWTAVDFQLVLRVPFHHSGEMLK